MSLGDKVDKVAIMNMIARVAELSRGNDINELGNELATMKSELDKVKEELAKPVDPIDKMEDQLAASKWNGFNGI